MDNGLLLQNSDAGNVDNETSTGGGISSLIISETDTVPTEEAESTVTTAPTETVAPTEAAATTEAVAPTGTVMPAEAAETTVGPADSNSQDAAVQLTPTISVSADQNVSEETSGFNMGLVIGIAVLGVLAITAVIFILLKRRKPVSPVVPDQNDGTGKDNGGKMDIIISNLHNIGKRDSQQDSFSVSDISNTMLRNEKGILAIVADGMGGLTGGAEISALVTSYMIKSFTQQCPGNNIPNELLQMIAGVNNEACDYIRMKGYAQSGSTVVATWIKENKLYFISVGDSRIYLYRNASLVQLNREHNYANELAEKVARGEISIESAQTDRQRAALTSHIGMKEMKHVDYSVRPMTLLKGDKLLLMSDGVFGTLSDDEMTGIIEHAATPYEAAEAIEGAVLYKDNPKQDNFTAVIISLE